MGTEIERKFLVTNDAWKADVFEVKNIVQAYVSSNVRVRETKTERVDNLKCTMTVKKDTPNPIERFECEFSIPESVADELFEQYEETTLTKKRYMVKRLNKDIWEVDVFSGTYKGLVVAEIELKSADQHVELPPWVGEEVTGVKEYSNSYLARNQ